MNLSIFFVILNVVLGIGIVFGFFFLAYFLVKKQSKTVFWKPIAKSAG